ncbi:MAG: PilN domain-containing protein [Candidatus Geothermincolia bacterium]
MTKINLLPPEKIKAKRKPAERSFWWLLVVLPVFVLVILAFLYFGASSQVATKNKQLKEAQQELTDWQNKNTALQQYKNRQDQITTLESSVVGALQGRVYWARILNNIAINCPTDIWLSVLNGTSGEATSAGTVEFSGFALQCPNRDNLTRFYPYFPDYKPIANWLERMAQITEFQRVWLSTAAPARQGSEPEMMLNWPFKRTTSETNALMPYAATENLNFTGVRVIQFTSTATLNMETATIGGPKPAPAAAAPAAPSTEGGTE